MTPPPSRKKRVSGQLQLVGSEAYRCQEKQRPTANPVAARFDKKKRRQQNAHHDQYLEAEGAKQHVAKIQRHITQPLPPQLAPQRPGIPRGKVKPRQIRHAPLVHQPLSESHMPPRVRDAHLSERDGKNTNKQGKPPSRFFEARGRPFMSIDCGCFPHPSIPYCFNQKNPRQKSSPVAACL